MASATPTNEPGTKGVGYTVVARRYRPQSFDDVVGQDHVVRALKNAIELHRITHAYLFCGTRGVGKTSLARIFAKCLNCEKGPTTTPCQTCDICRSISVGQDIDVIEIDGASNNGVEAVRDLRQNANLRPSRSKFKIYYIDEVHMLTVAAFNALLKTLEEPPEHVKFLFATTEVNKIPVTILSRCQRYDFAAISTSQIVETLREICKLEGVQADDDALQIVARRGAGSMRDAQSLLERLLSSGSELLTGDGVHQLLGTASDDRLIDILDALSSRQAGAALQHFDQGVDQGVQPVDMLNGLLEFLRDIMVVSISADIPLQTAVPRQKPQIIAIAKRWTLDSTLAALQIFSDTRIKLRGSVHSRLIIELALVRVARLEDLTELSDVVARLASLESGGPVPLPVLSSLAVSSPSPVVNDSPVKKKSPDLEPLAKAQPVTAPIVQQSPPVAPISPPSPSRPNPPAVVANSSSQNKGAKTKTSGLVDLDHAQRILSELTESVGFGERFLLSSCRVISSPKANLLVIGYPSGYNNQTDMGNLRALKPRLENSFRTALQLPIEVEFRAEASEHRPAPARLSAKHLSDLEKHPVVRPLIDLFEAKIVSVEAAETQPEKRSFTEDSDSDEESQPPEELESMSDLDSDDDD